MVSQLAKKGRQIQLLMLTRVYLQFTVHVTHIILMVSLLWTCLWLDTIRHTHVSKYRTKFTISMNTTKFLLRSLLHGFVDMIMYIKPLTVINQYEPQWDWEIHQTMANQDSYCRTGVFASMLLVDISSQQEEHSRRNNSLWSTQTC